MLNALNIFTLQHRCTIKTILYHLKYHGILSLNNTLLASTFFIYRPDRQDTSVASLLVHL